MDPHYGRGVPTSAGTLANLRKLYFFPGYLLLQDNKLEQAIKIYENVSSLTEIEKYNLALAYIKTNKNEKVEIL